MISDYLMPRLLWNGVLWTLLVQQNRSLQFPNALNQETDLSPIRSY